MEAPVNIPRLLALFLLFQQASLMPNPDQSVTAQKAPFDTALVPSPDELEQTKKSFDEKGHVPVIIQSASRGFSPNYYFWLACYWFFPKTYQRELCKQMRAQPINDPKLIDVVHCVMTRYGMKKCDASVMTWEDPLSSAPFFTLGSTVFLEKTALQQLADEEAAFVVAHELAHVKHKGSSKLLVANSALAAAEFSLGCLTEKKLGGKIPYLAQHPIMARVTNSVLWIPLSIPGLLALLAMSRTDEKQADLDAAKALNSAQGGISFFKRFIQRKPLPFIFRIASYGNTHPSSETRIAYLEQWERDNEAF